MRTLDFVFCCLAMFSDTLGEQPRVNDVEIRRTIGNEFTVIFVGQTIRLRGKGAQVFRQPQDAKEYLETSARLDKPGQNELLKKLKDRGICEEGLLPEKVTSYVLLAAHSEEKWLEGWPVTVVTVSPVNDRNKQYVILLANLLVAR